jgi:hypothetical protein
MFGAACSLLFQTKYLGSVMDGYLEIRSVLICLQFEILPLSLSPFKSTVVRKLVIAISKELHVVKNNDKFFYP